MADYTAAIRLKPSEGETYCACAMAWLSLGFIEKSLQDMNRAISIAPDCAAVLCVPS